MWAEDRASQSLGMQLDRVGNGEASLSLTVREDMTNGHGIAHGGFVFTLADSAFAFACNSSGQRAVANQCQITYVAPARAGDVLTATAKEIHRAGRQGITDVVVRRADGTVIAHFRGHSRTIKGSLFDGAPVPSDT
ncbi:MAG: hydroxyphenylacetyl-CoA thioesterase PaaI [Pseudomonadota bacterium]